MAEREKEIKSKDDLGRALTELLGDQKTVEYYQRVFCALASKVTGGGRFSVQKDAETNVELMGIGFGPSEPEKETIIQIRKNSFFIREGRRISCSVKSSLCLPKEAPQVGVQVAIASKGGSTLFLGLVEEHHANGEVLLKVSIVSEHLL